MTYQQALDNINFLSRKANELRDKLLQEGKNHRDPEFKQVFELWYEWEKMEELIKEIPDGYKYVLEHPYDKSRASYNNEFSVGLILDNSIPEDGVFKVYTSNPNLTSEHEVILIPDVNDERWKELL